MVYMKTLLESHISRKRKRKKWLDKNRLTEGEKVASERVSAGQDQQKSTVGAGSPKVIISLVLSYISLGIPT